MMRWFALGAVTLLAVSCNWYGGNKTEKKTIYDVVSETQSLSTLAKAVDEAGLADTLKSDKGPFILFAPTDAAFKELPNGTLDNLMKPENKEKLQKVLKYHLVSSKDTLEQLVKNKTQMSVEGEALEFTMKDGKTMVEDAEVDTKPMMASNGVVYTINKVLIPKS